MSHHHITRHCHFSPTCSRFQSETFQDQFESKALNPEKISQRRIRAASFVSFLLTFCHPTPHFPVSYPPRSWWVPGCEGVWWKQTPAPRCPPSADPPSPRWRSASLPPPSTPRCHHHHTLTQTRSLSRPPRLQDQEQDPCSHPHRHSSSPAPTPALRRPTSTGWGTSSTHLLFVHFLNPDWVRMEVWKAKTWPQAYHALNIIRKTLKSKRRKGGRWSTQKTQLLPFCTSSQLWRIQLSDSLWRSLALSDEHTASVRSKGREDEREGGSDEGRAAERRGGAAQLLSKEVHIYMECENRSETSHNMSVDWNSAMVMLFGVGTHDRAKTTS